MPSCFIQSAEPISPRQNVNFSEGDDSMSFDECMQLLAETFPLAEVRPMPRFRALTHVVVSHQPSSEKACCILIEIYARVRRVIYRTPPPAWTAACPRSPAATPTASCLPSSPLSPWPRCPPPPSSQTGGGQRWTRPGWSCGPSQSCRYYSCISALLHCHAIRCRMQI